jgi:hypothetical protein
MLPRLADKKVSPILQGRWTRSDTWIIEKAPEVANHTPVKPSHRAVWWLLKGRNPLSLGDFLGEPEGLAHAV